MSNVAMDKNTKELLSVVADFDGESFKGAFNIRSNSHSIGRASTENIKIEPKEGSSGLDIRIAPGTKGENVYIPACVTQGNIDDLTYNDFYVGEGADVTIIAGCGVHTETGEPARHSGIHRFFLEKNSKVLYLEKHVGTSDGEGRISIDPKTECTLKENAYLEMDTSQLGGVTHTDRQMSATLEKDATLIVKERLLTDKDEVAKTTYRIELNGEGSGVNLISRSVARGNSTQEYESVLVGNAECHGHSECDAILAENGRVNAAPRLIANNQDAELIHEAAIGKIAGEQILKLRTLGLTSTEAETAIIDGFLK